MSKEQRIQYRKYYIQYLLRHIEAIGTQGLSIFMQSNQVSAFRLQEATKFLASIVESAQPISVTVTVSLLDSPHDIDAKFKDAKHTVTQQREDFMGKEILSKSMFAVHEPQNAGRKVSWDTLLKKLGESLTAYDLRKADPSSTLYSIASEMGLPLGTSQKDFDNAAREVRRRIAFASMLIEAVAKGTFHIECMKPFPRNL